MDGLKATLSFDAFAYDYDDEYLTIDTDTHTININNVSRLFGVQYDGNSKLIKFRIRNKLSDIQKMQDSIVYINWIDSRGVKGQSIAINKTINNDTCEFAWKVPFDALKNSGVLHFAMSAVVTKNSSSVIDQRWSTQIASVITPDGIYIKSYTPSSEEEDRIAQIYNELSNMINKQNDNLQSQVNSLNKALAKYTKAIEDSEVDKKTLDLYGDFARGYLVDGVYKKSTYRVASRDKMIFEHNIYLKSLDGYLFDVHLFSNGVYSSKSGWTSKYTIDSNTEFMMQIRKEPENLQELVDVDQCVESVYFLTESVKNTPEYYGAIGDGVTDDKEAIQAAIDNNDIVFFASKTYRISSAIEISKSISLCGGTHTVLLCDNGGIIVKHGCHDVDVSDISLKGIKSNNSIGVSFENNNYRVNIRHMTIDSFMCGLYATYFWTCTFDSLQFNNVTTCVNIRKTEDGTIGCYVVTFRNCGFGKSVYGVSVDGVATCLSFYDCAFDGSNRCFYVKYTSNILIQNCGFERYSSNIIVSTRSVLFTIIGGHCYLDNSVNEDFAISGGKITCIGFRFRENFNASGIKPLCIGCDNIPINSSIPVIN